MDVLPCQTSAEGRTSKGVWSRSPDAGIKLLATSGKRRWLEARHTEESTL
jgi:hypothetical protein